jgi:pilus assembly protein CpaF
MGLLERLERKTEVDLEEKINGPSSKNGEEYDIVRIKAHREVIDRINKQGRTEPLKEIISDAVELYGEQVNRTEKNRISHELYDEVVGLGPLEKLIGDPSVTEIMVNGPNRVYVEREGKLQLTDVTFRDEDHVLNILDKIVSPIGRHVDEGSPMVDARLKDGSRVNAIIRPLSLNGPIITIRKFSHNPLTVKDLLRFHSLSFPMASFLEACVKGRLNLIVSGGTGSGKTTLLNVLSSFIPPTERIVTIEDAAELRLMQEHVITLESRPANVEGKGQISIRELVRNALRMRPDRIVVGEVRGGEALDMLQAMNTGHDGSLTTAHANSPRDLLSRIETMVLMSGMELPIKAIRDQVASAIDLIIQQARLGDGTRKVINISEIVGMEGDVIVTQDLFLYESEGRLDDNGKIHGRFRPTGTVPQFITKLQTNGIYIDNSWFIDGRG